MANEDQNSQPILGAPKRLPESTPAQRLNNPTTQEAEFVKDVLENAAKKAAEEIEGKGDYAHPPGTEPGEARRKGVLLYYYETVPVLEEGKPLIENGKVVLEPRKHKDTGDSVLGEIRGGVPQKVFYDRMFEIAAHDIQAIKDSLTSLDAQKVKSAEIKAEIESARNQIQLFEETKRGFNEHIADPSKVLCPHIVEDARKTIETAYKKAREETPDQVKDRQQEGTAPSTSGDNKKLFVPAPKPPSAVAPMQKNANSSRAPTTQTNEKTHTKITPERPDADHEDDAPRKGKKVDDLPPLPQESPRYKPGDKVAKEPPKIKQMGGVDDTWFLQNAVATLMRLDRGVSIDAERVINLGPGDRILGLKELSDISDSSVSGDQWNGEFKVSAVALRKELAEAMKLGGNEVTLENVKRVVDAAQYEGILSLEQNPEKLAAVIYTTLETGNLPKGLSPAAITEIQQLKFSIESGGNAAQKQESLPPATKPHGKSH